MSHLRKAITDQLIANTMRQQDNKTQDRALSNNRPSPSHADQDSPSKRITTAQEDYLETTLRLEAELTPNPVRITDIAEALGTRLPTVSRTVSKLTEMGLMIHPARGRVELSKLGRILANEIKHRHEDLVELFTNVLGLPRKIAEEDTCQIEHGLSPTAAQRLHEFIEYLENLPKEQSEVIERFRLQAGKKISEFKNLPQNRTAGWRG